MGGVQDKHKAVLLPRGEWSHPGSNQSLYGHRRTVVAACCNPCMFQRAGIDHEATCVVALGDMAGKVRGGRLGACPDARAWQHGLFQCSCVVGLSGLHGLQPAASRCV